MPSEGLTVDQSPSVRLLATIDREIDLLDAAAQRTGWTPWVLQAAIATLVWALLGELRNYTRLDQAVLAAVTALLWHRLMKFAAAGLRGHHEPASLNRLTVAYAALLETIFLAATVWLWWRGVVSWWMVTLIGAQFLIVQLGLLLGFLAAAIPFALSQSDPTPPERSKRRLRLSGLVVGLLVGSCVSAALAARVLTIEDWRVGAVGFAIVAILGVLAQTPIQEPIRSELVALRRALALGLSSCEEAERRLRHATVGLPVSNLMAAIGMAATRVAEEMFRERAEALRPLLESRDSIRAAVSRASELSIDELVKAHESVGHALAGIATLPKLWSRRRIVQLIWRTLWIGLTDRGLLDRDHSGTEDPFKSLSELMDDLGTRKLLQELMELSRALKPEVDKRAEAQRLRELRHFKYAPPAGQPPDADP